MEKSPYDPSAQECFARNQKRLKEELAEYEANCKLLEKYLEQADLTWKEVRESTPQEPKAEKDTKAYSKKFPQRNWMRI